MPAASNFVVANTTLQPPKDQEVVVRNLFMSVDPYMRGRMDEGKSYVPPFELGLRPREDTCGRQRVRNDRTARSPGQSPQPTNAWTLAR
jgi:NADPH-dependent curcumin reductase CurA